MFIQGFDWDLGNRDKCNSHGVSLEEVESVFVNEPLVSANVQHQSKEDRYHAVGRTNTGRHAYVVFTFREGSEGTLIRPISARFMHQKEIDHYEKQIKR
jgi:uncharacterized protein